MSPGEVERPAVGCGGSSILGLCSPEVGYDLARGSRSTEMPRGGNAGLEISSGRGEGDEDRMTSAEVEIEVVDASCYGSYAPWS